MSIFNRFKKHKKEEKEIEKLRPLTSSNSVENKETKRADKKEAKVGEKTVAPEKALKLKKPRKTELKKFENVHNVLVRPLVTEKISNLGMYNQYAFEVKPKANKVQIKKAIETYYNVRPVKVNIINIQGKNVRWGRTRGRTQDSKKAIVTLRQGDKIEVYEGV